MSKVSMDLETEKKLVEQIQEGGEKGKEAVEKLYKHYKKHLEKFFRARLGSDPVVEDLVANVFEKALSGIDSFRWQNVSLSAWLYKISRNVLVDYYREDDKRSTTDIEDIRPPETKDQGPEDNYVDEEKKELLRGLLDELPEREQKIIYLKFFRGRTNKWIAEELGLTETNVGTIVYRSIRKMREMVETC